MKTVRIIVGLFLVLGVATFNGVMGYWYVFKGNIQNTATVQADQNMVRKVFAVSFSEHGSKIDYFLSSSQSRFGAFLLIISAVQFIAGCLLLVVHRLSTVLKLILIGSVFIGIMVPAFQIAVSGRIGAIGIVGILSAVLTGASLRAYRASGAS